MASLPTTRPISFVTPLIRAILEGRKIQTRRLLKPQPTDGTPFDQAHLTCPFGQPGDQLWVREKWAYRRDVQSLFSIGDSEIVYAADLIAGCSGAGWKPSRFMPKKCCRLWLTIESLRVERVNQISASDALSEGFAGPASEAKPWFEQLWNSLCEESTQFDLGPWVWVIGFAVNPLSPQSL